VSEHYVCAVSGIAVDPAEDGEMPVGWAEVSLLIRRENPEWKELMQARGIVVDQQLAQLPEEQREAARPLATMLARATFAALEIQTPRYLVDEREVHVSGGQLPSLLEMLGEADER
jgi:hypothetical protein